MKKLFYLLTGFGLLMSACEYDDSDLVNRVGDLEDRVTTLEETIETLNQDIAGVQTLVEALDGNVYVSKIEEGENGYTIYFTDGEQITISDGKDSADGSTVTVKLDETDGNYYWAVTENGITEYIEVDGQRLPVKGEKGNTPLMRVTMEGETGYWEVSYDNGETWERILLADGTPVTTSGGAGGLFKDAYIDEDTNSVVFVFLNGEELVIELRSDLFINFKGEAVESAAFAYGETKTFEMEAVGVKRTVVTSPDEWKASFDKQTAVLSVTAPAPGHVDCAAKEGEVALIYFGDENQSSAITFKVFIGQYVTVAEENLTHDVVATGATLTVPFTADGEVTAASEQAWLTPTLAEGNVEIVVAANTGAERTGTVVLKAKDGEAVITVNQEAALALQPYGYRVGSETQLWAKPLSEITGITAANVSHIAATGKYLIVNAAGEAPAVLDAVTGEYVGALNLGDLAGANAAITADDAGNIIISTFAEADGFRVARMKSINDTPEVFITRASQEYGKDISVVGDVYGDARVTMMYSPWSSGTTGNLLYQVVGGVADGGYWSKVAAGALAAAPNNNNGDVIYRDMGAGAPYFISGYSNNQMVWVENAAAVYAQPTANSNCGAVCLDVEKFNNAYYLMSAADTYFTWDTAYAYLADVTTLDNFKAGIVTYKTGDYGWSVGSNGSGNTDCALRVSEDGIYMYAYVVYAGGSVGCIRVDCLAE